MSDLTFDGYLAEMRRLIAENPEEREKAAKLIQKSGMLEKVAALAITLRPMVQQMESAASTFSQRDSKQINSLAAMACGFASAFSRVDQCADLITGATIIPPDAPTAELRRLWNGLDAAQRETVLALIRDMTPK